MVNQIHRRSADVARLCRALEVATHHQVGANLYLTPRDSQGFVPHADTHDVFVLRLHGHKEWHVAGPDNALPVATAKQRRLATFDDSHAFTLGPGDLLYLPRGFPHEAVTSGSPSLHLTVGIHVYPWLDLLAEALSLRWCGGSCSPCRLVASLAGFGDGYGWRRWRSDHRRG